MKERSFLYSPAHRTEPTLRPQPHPFPPQWSSEKIQVLQSVWQCSIIKIPVKQVQQRKNLYALHCSIKKPHRIMRILDLITAFHKSRDRSSEITELLYHSCRRGHTYMNIKLHIHTYIP